MWTKRELKDDPNSLWSDIWDYPDVWQINKAKEDGKYHLLDAAMPWWIPASSFLGKFDTLEEAQAQAASMELYDWSEWMDKE